MSTRNAYDHTNAIGNEYLYRRVDAQPPLAAAGDAFNGIALLQVQKIRDTGCIGDPLRSMESYRMCARTLLLLLLMPFSALAQDNPELSELMAADQAARRATNEQIDWVEVNKEDEERRTAVLSIIKAGGVRTARDYYGAAMIFQHGDSADDIRLAHALATISSVLAEESSSSNWLKAASWDRLMLRLGQPQWYGTQFVKDDSGRWALYQVHPDAVTDEQRVLWSVPSLEQSRERAETMNDAQ